MLDQSKGPCPQGTCQWKHHSQESGSPKMRSAFYVSVVLVLGNQSNALHQLWQQGQVSAEGAGVQMWHWRVLCCTRPAQEIPRHQGQVEAVNQNDTADGDATSICCKRHPRYIRKCRADLATGTADTSTTSCPCWPGSIWDMERCREDVLWQEILVA